MSSIEQWRVFRHSSVVGPQGDLSLAGMYEVNSGVTFSQVPGSWSPTFEDRPGLTVNANIGDGLKINGKPIDEKVELIADETIVEIATGITAMATHQPGSPHLLAVWDQSEERLATFKEIDYYPFDVSWILQGTFVKDDTNQTFSFSHTSDSGQHTRLHESPGSIQFVHEGKTYQVRPFKSGDYQIIVFRDATSGQETYGMGRMLIVQQEEDGKVTLDFNRAFLPPCAFSPHFNCPMPPKSNIFAFSVNAGEKTVLHA